MQRLIDADALTDELIKGIEADTDRSIQTSFTKSVCMILCKAIEQQPTIDAEPVRHGKWRFESIRGHAVMTCSECCKVQDGQTLCFTYCPSCGARMDKERDSDHAEEEIL